MKKILLILVSIIALVVVQCGKDSKTTDTKKEEVTEEDPAIANGKYVKVTSAAMVRNKGSKKGKAVKCTIDYEDPDSDMGNGMSDKTVKSAPKGSIFKIAGSSDEKVKIGKMNSYWYKVKSTKGMIKVKGNEGRITCPKNTWIYGGLLKKTSKKFKKFTLEAAGC